MKVFVKGFWASNLGDDLFLYILCRRFPNISFEINVKEKYRDTLPTLPNLMISEEIVYKRAIFYDKVKELCNYLCSTFIGNKTTVFTIKGKVFIANKPNIFIEIGGSIFMLKSDENVRKNIEYLIRMKMVEIVDGYYVIGSNFGPYYDNKQLTEYRNFFKRTTDTCFRDSYSRNLFPELENVREAADIILSGDFTNFENQEKEHILISVVDLEKKGDPGLDISYENVKTYEKQIVYYIKEFVSKKEKVILFSFCDNQGDVDLSKRIFDKLDEESKKNVKILSYKNIDTSIEVIKKSKKIIATRFHAMILGWLFQIPTYAVSYSQKTENVIRSSYPNQNFCKYSDISQIDFNELSNSFCKIDDETLNKLINYSSKQFQKLDQIFGDTNG
ncbi:polysaccharide pyruvyl transferase family protein [Enterococcus gilvus]|uniref:polysaccharide pyruvyl transferase family protein n=1 Tax=Enterococcus gilvus TaxID=160453 RepID=UPI00345E85B5